MKWISIVNFHSIFTKVKYSYIENTDIELLMIYFNFNEDSYGYFKRMHIKNN